MLGRSLALFLLTSSLVGGTVRSELKQLPCEEAANWVAWNEGKLPTSIAEFESFDVNYRKRIYGALSADRRAKLWNERFDELLADSTLAPTVVNELKLVERELQSIILENPAGIQRGTELDSRVRSMGRKVRELVNPAKARMLTSLRGHDSARKQEECDCDTSNSNVEDDCPASDGSCKPGKCEYSPLGCGDFWLYSCDGLCSRNS